jgi:hypothetical protein
VPALQDLQRNRPATHMEDNLMRYNRNHLENTVAHPQTRTLCGNIEDRPVVWAMHIGLFTGDLSLASSSKHHLTITSTYQSVTQPSLSTPCNVTSAEGDRYPGMYPTQARIGGTRSV